MLTKYTKSLVADGSGDLTTTVGDEIHGKVEAIRYNPITMDVNADVSVRGSVHLQTILTKANAGTTPSLFYPRAVASKSADGSNSSLSEVHAWLLGESIQIVIAQGGAAGTGTIDIWVDEVK
jgi:hypothetical protein